MKLLLIVFFLPLSAFSNTSKFEYFQNILLPFTSDGCSQFPDSLGNLDWQSCCKEHDLAYWMGGTQYEKSQVDESLKKCVQEIAGTTLGALMKLGVQIGGIAGLPTSWHWGYGWIVSRGYEALSPFEKNQVQRLMPNDLRDVEITKANSVPIRPSITGDYCLDIALSQITRMQDDNFINYQVFNITTNSSPEGTTKKIEIKTDHCPNPYNVEFLLLGDRACESPTNELLARGRVRLQKIKPNCK